MECANCGGETEVVDSRKTDQFQIRRYRKCRECGNRMTTKELLVSNRGSAIEALRVPEKYKQRISNTKELKKKLVEHDLNIENCWLCGSENDLVIHHIVPVNKGGSDDVENLSIVCENCHDNKAHKNGSEDTPEIIKRKLQNLHPLVGA